MATDEKTIPDGKAAGEQPKQMSNTEIWLKIIADQKLIREELKRALHFKNSEKSMASFLKPYDYSILKKDYYHFVTQSGDKYTCYFLS